MYLYRYTSKGLETSKYFVKGGAFNTYADILQLPNCTTFAFLQSQQNMNAVVKQNYIIRESGGFGEAKTWYDTTTLPKGDEIKEGAIFVFDGTSGHVGIVIKKIDDTHALVCDSRYKSNKSLRNEYYFRVTEMELVVGKATMSGVGKLKGFIYVPINDKRVERDNTKNQVSINDMLVNARREPNGELCAEGCFVPQGIYNVLEFKQEGQYEWAKLDEGYWVALGDWSTVYKVASIDYKEKYEIAQSKLDRIKEIINE